MSLDNRLTHYLKIIANARKETIMKEYKIWKKHFLILFIFGLITSFSSLAIAKTMSIEINDAQVLRFDGDVTEVFIANPEIADVQLTNPHSAYVYGKTAGRTRLFAVNSKGKEVLSAEINVIYDVSQLREMIAPFDPYGLIEIKSIPGAIVLEGQADSPKTA